MGQPCNIVKLERGFSAVIMGGHSHSKGICLVLLNGFAVQLVDLNGCVLTGGHSKACSFCNLSATCFLCSNGHSYSAVCCIGSRHNTELLSGQGAVIHITRHSRPSVAAITAPLHLAAGRDKGHLVNGIIIGGNTYGKVLYFTGFHSSTIKAVNGNGSRYSIFVHGIVNLAVCYIIRFRVNHSSSILCGIPSDEHFSIFCRLANTIDLFLCQMFLAPNLFNCLCVTTICNICKSTTIRVKNHIAIIVDTLIIIGK